MDANVPDNHERIRHVVGVMTGTSIDGIDAALVRIEGRGLDMHATLVRHVARPLGDLCLRLRLAAEQTPMTAGDFAKLAWDFGHLHVAAIRDLIGDTRPNLICAHGQTVFHQPPNSWQLLNAAPISHAFGCPIISDLRQADLAAGGQGAPITPISDWVLFRHPEQPRAIVNLGGFCNVTILPGHKTFPTAAASPRVFTELNAIRGFDVCTCNQLLDAAARAVLHTPFDPAGQAASSSTPDRHASDSLHRLLISQPAQGRSLGTGDELAAWVSGHVQQMSPGTLLASICDAIARCICDSIATHEHADVVLAGGGVRNRALVKGICTHSEMRALTSDELGVPVDAREAMCFAILGALCTDGVAITLPQVTGCSAPAPISGVWSRPSASMP